MVEIIFEMLSKSNINTDIVSFDFNEDDFTENEHADD